MRSGALRNNEAYESPIRERHLLCHFDLGSDFYGAIQLKGDLVLLRQSENDGVAVPNRKAPMLSAFNDDTVPRHLSFSLLRQQLASKESA